MADFTKIVLIVLGVLALAGGVYNAVDSWRSDLSLDETRDRNLALARALGQAAALISEGRFDEARRVEERARAANPLPTPLEIEVSRYLSAFWLASGLVSWAFLWGLAAIISELKLLRSLVARELELGPESGAADA